MVSWRHMLQRRVLWVVLKKTTTLPKYQQSIDELWWRAENDTLLFSVLIAAPWLYLEVLRGKFLPQTLVVFIFKQGVVLAWVSGNWLFNRIISLADANEQKF